MAILEVAPTDLSDGGVINGNENLGTVGVLPIDARLEKFNIMGTSYENTKIYAKLVAQMLGEKVLKLCANGEESLVELTQHSDEDTKVISILDPRKTVDGATGYSYNFISIKDGQRGTVPGVLLFEYHDYILRGTTEKHGDPSPMNETAAERLGVLLGSLHGPRAKS